MRVLRVVCVLFLGGSAFTQSAFAQSKTFTCLVSSAIGPKGSNVTVVTKPETILGKPHQVGTSEVGRWGGSTFWISWDATEPSVTVGRKDTDGFEMSASSDGGMVILIGKRPNEPEIRVMCGAK
jgi:hypothetical protein